MIIFLKGSYKYDNNLNIQKIFRLCCYFTTIKASYFILKWHIY